MSGTGPSRVGPYEILRELGRGGMGVVYLARDGRLGRDVAIKALPEDLAQDAGRLDRFEREARTLAGLNHPNIAGIYGVEEQEGRRYLVLEYVEGETLADRLDRGPLAVEDAVEVAVEIARGLEAAHEAGVVHRDLKPANIKVTPEGKVKVLDFGLAKSDDGASSTGSGLSQSPTMTSPMPQHSPTIPGAILGTAAYMSPEQARGRRVDKRTDIWAYGVILYEMLTGLSPFVGETATDSIGAVLHKDVDQARLPSGTPDGVRRVLARCLERDRDLRYRDIGDVRIELSRRTVEPVAPARDAARWLLGPIGLVGWLVAVVAMVLLLVIRGSGADVLSGPIRSAVMAPEGYTIGRFEVAPDGGQIAMLVNAAEVGDVPGPRRTMLSVRDLSAESPTLIEGTDGAFTHRYSPDGRTIAFLTRGAESSMGVRLMSFPRDLSATPIEVMRVPQRFEVGGTDTWYSWTAAGEIAFLQRSEEAVYLFDPGTGRELGRVAIALDDETLALESLIGPFGDHGLGLEISRYTPDGFALDSAVIDLETGEVSTLVEGGVGLRRLPGGRVLFARSDTVFLASYDASSMQLVGSLRPVQRGLGTGSHWDHGNYRLSESGTLVYAGGGVQGQSRELVFLDRDGTAEVWFDERRPFEAHAAVSLDGERLAVLIAGPGGLYELWVSETDRPRLRRLHGEAGGDVLEPVFTPDGEHIVAACWNPSAEETGRMMVFSFDGSEPPRQIGAGWGSSEWVIPASVSFDGGRVLVLRYEGGMARLREAPLDGVGEPRTLLELDELFTPRYPPTEDPLLCYVSTETGRAEVFVRRIEESGLGPAIPVTTRGAWVCNWMVDPVQGLCILHYDLGWREHITPVSFEDGRIEIGETEPTGLIGNTRYGDRTATRDGRYLTIRSGEDERPVTHLELVQGWLGSIGE